jgi:hypothetical protein
MILVCGGRPFFSYAPIQLSSSYMDFGQRWRNQILPLFGWKLRPLREMSRSRPFHGYENARFESISDLLLIQPSTTERVSPCMRDMWRWRWKTLSGPQEKNYGLEEIPELKHGRNIRSIFELNRAGRRYLVQDGSSISKGVDVLIGVWRVVATLWFLASCWRIQDCATEASSKFRM